MAHSQPLRIKVRLTGRFKSLFPLLGASLRIRLSCSFLRTRLRLARGIGPLLLALLLHSAVRLLALPLLSAHVAIGAALPLLSLNVAVALALQFLTLRVLIELLTEAMLALLSHGRLSRYCKAHAKPNNKTKISYFHSFPLFPNFCYSNRLALLSMTDIT